MKKVLVKLKLRIIHDMIGQSGAPPRPDKINCMCTYGSKTHLKRNSHKESVTTFEVSINSHNMCW
jgi:hypothetical protein